MKYISILLFIHLIAVVAQAQTINWNKARNTNKHFIQGFGGLDYSLSFGAGYAYRLPSWLPLVLGIDASVPAGNQIFDDLKSRVGVQTRLGALGDFALSARLYGNFRRYENAFIRMAGFGGEFSGAIGYYRKHWFAAAEAGFDKAIATHMRHSAAAREDFPGITDGWYVPTAGNFSYGLQAGVSFGRFDICLKAGKVIEQDFETTPLLPFYGQIGVNVRW